MAAVTGGLVRSSTAISVVVVALVAVCGCSSDGEGGGAPAGDAGDAAADAADATDATADVLDEVNESGDAVVPVAYTLSFVRLDADEMPGFAVRLRPSSVDPSLTEGDVVLTASRGVPVSEVTEDGGVFSRVFHADDDGTGEYAVTATVRGEEVAGGTALVMKSVGARWGQPRKVEGLVNTEGWEDGANVTADGEFLFVQYLPITASCLLGGAPDIESPFCSKARGPVTAPERPGMPGAERVAPDGTIQHGCPSIGLPSLPIPLPPNTLYGFRRQADGSYAEPFYVAFDGIDGCASPFGITFLAGEAGPSTMLLAYDDPFDNDPPNTDSHADVFVFENVVLGEPIVLGRYSLVGGKIQLDDFGGTLVAATKEGHYGNPGAYLEPGGRVQLWFDDELTVEEQRGLGAILFEAGTFPGGQGTAPQSLPAPVNQDGMGEIQPFFDGTDLLLRRGWDIVSVGHKGGDIFSSSSWETEEPILVSDVQAIVSMKAGAIVTTGEPTKAVVNGRAEVYFVYGVVEADGSIDLNVGVVEER